MKIKKAKVTNSNVVKPKKNLSLIIFLGVLIVVIAGGLFFSFSKLFATEKYYVLNADVPAKTAITSQMLTTQETAEGTAPQNGITMAEIQKGNLYAKYAMNKGDVVSHSNTGPISNNYDGIPDSWVVTSFTAPADNSVDGHLSRGDYFDLITASDTVDNTKYLLTGGLILDVTSSSSQTDANGKETVAAGSNLIYTIGLPAQDARRVHSALTAYNAASLHLVRSPISMRYEKRNVSDLNAQLSNSDSPIDTFDGTDPSFSPVVRDSDSRPVNKENCKEGKIKTKDLCKINGFSEGK